jgi:deoxyribose-phosphate aldolase
MDQKELIDKIAKEVMQRLTEKSLSKGTADQGNTQPHATTTQMSKTEFEQLCAEALKYKFKSVCVNSSWVPFVAKKLRGSGIEICSVIGFPLGGMDTRSKAFEARSAIASGATELDMVINVGALKSGNLKLVEEDIRAIKRACRSTTILKVILETGLLTEAEKILACEICKKAEADFVKTSTGFAGSGATVEDIALMRRIVGPKMGVKASGGIKTFDQAIALINAGASRLGCGASVAIITGAESQGNY